MAPSLKNPVNALGQLEEQVKNSQYADIAQSLAVSNFVFWFLVCAYGPPIQGSQTNLSILQAVYVGPTYCPNLKTRARDSS